MPQSSRSAPRLSLSGMSVDHRYVHIGVEVRNMGQTRFTTLKIPLNALLHDDIISALDEAARRRLNEVWTQRMDQGTLFEVPEL